MVIAAIIKGKMEDIKKVEDIVSTQSGIIGLSNPRNYLVVPEIYTLAGALDSVKKFIIIDLIIVARIATTLL